MTTRMSYRAALLSWQARERMKRVGRAWRYALGRTTPGDAENMLYDCQHIAGSYALETLSVASVLTMAQERYGDDPSLAGFAAQACHRVWNRWNSSGDQTGAAEDWAMDLIAEYAADDSIKLVDSWSLEAAEAEAA